MLCLLLPWVSPFNCHLVPGSSLTCVCAVRQSHIKPLILLEANYRLVHHTFSPLSL